jgi:GTP-binding protein Era
MGGAFKREREGISPEMTFKSGFVSIIGRPNVGKSTLLNALLGEKVSIVSEKPQTTRNTIRGVKSLKDCQIVFLDTPGVHGGKGLLNRFMVNEALQSLKGVDAAVLVVEAGARGPATDDHVILDGLKGFKRPVILCINKIDRVEKRTILPLIAAMSGLHPFEEVVPLSARTGDGVPILLDAVQRLMPEGPRYFPEDVVTDSPARFVAAEFIREKINECTRDEVPYSVAVVVESFKEKKDGLVSISAVINVERDSQKGIIIGSRGSMLKRIGRSARLSIEDLLGARVYLELFVRVEKDWTRSPKALKEFGY